MKKNLIALLGLEDGASDELILGAVKALVDGAAAAKSVTSEQAEVTRLIAQSGNALTERTARDTIRNRAAYAKANPPKAPAKAEKK